MSQLVIAHSARPPSECHSYRPPPRFAEYEECFHLLRVAWVTEGVVAPPVEPRPLAACVSIHEPDPVLRLDWMHSRGVSGTHFHICADCYRRVFGTE